jgi:hypothetical protein
MSPEPDPIDPDDDPLAAVRGRSLRELLALLEQLGGAEEAAVVRNALAAGVPESTVTAELEHEVERRLMQQKSAGWE